MFRMQNLFRILFFSIWLLVAGAVASQTEGLSRDTLESWKTLSSFTESLLDRGTTDTKELDLLRTKITKYREAFGAARNVGESRIRTVERRLAALGDPPGDGKEEPQEVAELRSELQVRLRELQMPKKIALQAFSHADGLIEEIDAVIRNLELEKTIGRGPAPLNPVNWAYALGDTIASVSIVLSELKSGIATAFDDPDFIYNLPLLISALVAGIVLCIYNRRWAAKLGKPLEGKGPSKTVIWQFSVSFLEILFPIVGTFIIFTSLNLSGMLGPINSKIAVAIPKWVALILTFSWLVNSLLSEEFRYKKIRLSEGKQKHLKLYVRLIAISFVFSDIGKLFDELSPVRQSSELLFQSLSIVVAAGTLGAIYQTGRRHITFSEDIEETKTQARVINLLRIVTPLVAIGCPVIAAVGYVPLALQVLFPFILTLAIVSAVFLLRQFLEEIIGWLFGAGEQGKGSLLVDFSAFGLYLLAIPFLAVSWGARPAELLEIWEKFLEGITVGETRISPGTILTFLAIFLIGYTAIRFLQNLLRNSLLPKTKLSAGAQNALALGAGYLGYFLTFLVAMSGAGISLSSLAIVAGALSVGIGFGLQTIVSNFVSGIILLVERPISKGDWIEIGGQMGYVRSISVRSTTIETFDRTDMIIPNQDLISGTVINYTRDRKIGRVIVPVGVAYGSDTKKVEGILLEVAEAHPMVLANPKPTIVFQGLNENAMNFEIRAIIRDVNWILTARTDLNHEIVRRFDEEGIVIPFSQHDVWLRNPKALPGSKS